MKINTSINDFAPLLRGPEFLFRGLQFAGVDGIELGVGFKSRWSIKQYQTLAKKYNLPIVSLHQPLWSGLGLYFDEDSFAIAKQLGVKQVVCHPLPKTSFQSSQMRTYLKKLSDMQEKFGIEILLENLPKEYNHKVLNHFFPPARDTGDIMAVYTAAKEFGFKITLDIDHLRISSPHKEEWFKTMLPLIGNIHLSSFDKKKKHMPLYVGMFQTQEFIHYLNQHNYIGLLTLEISAPSAITLTNYDFSSITKSVALIKSA